MTMPTTKLAASTISISRHVQLPGLGLALSIRIPKHVHLHRSRSSYRLGTILSQATFTSSSKSSSSGNRIYNSVRTPEDFNTILLATTGNNIPLITLWTTSYCSTCRQVTPLIRQLLEEHSERHEHPSSSGQGPEPTPTLSKSCKVAFAEIEMDAPDILPVAGNYVIRSVPTLLAFRRGLPIYEKALTSKHDLTNRERLVSWIEDVALEGEHDRKNLRGGLFSRLWGQ
ncbi:hypothetical protein DFH27DRAFT_103104 [Peziza echinospora]|nr:hypothetical protein DFH27DRAFT_103104 [Peziza echinospora]